MKLEEFYSVLTEELRNRALIVSNFEFDEHGVYFSVSDDSSSCWVEMSRPNEELADVRPKGMLFSMHVGQSDNSYFVVPDDSTEPTDDSTVRSSNAVSTFAADIRRTLDELTA